LKVIAWSMGSRLILEPLTQERRDFMWCRKCGKANMTNEWLNDVDTCNDCHSWLMRILLWIENTKWWKRIK
jgi:hypothetical protein